VLKRMMNAVFGDPNQKAIAKIQPFVDKINALESTYQSLSDGALREKTAEFKQRLAKGETLDDILPDAFAAVREAARRTIGLRHYDVQMIGGIVLHQGKIAEMKTGEGKTLVATLPLYLNSLEGKGVHLVTPNDYLSKVGCQLMGPVYHALGTTVGVIQSQGEDGVFQPAFLFDPDFNSDDDRLQHLRRVPRTDAYRADILYGTNNEFGFDYLRDNMVRSLRQKVQRELNFAIVDEVDNILIDEARTPLIISGPADEPSDMYGKMAQIVRNFKAIPQRQYDELAKAADQGDEEAEAEIARYQYVRDEKTRQTTVLDSGTERAERALGIENIYDPKNFEIAHYLDNAVRALGLYERDKEYIVSDKGEVIIVDEFTGRLMYGRRFSEGLHQAIEAKEGVTVQRENLTLATITFQNYFRMYNKLAGMTGTATTEAEEFGKIYSLDVVEIPTHRPNVRDDYADGVYKNENGKYRAVVNEIKEKHEEGRPVLVGTATIEHSEKLSRMLGRAGIQHEVLNAKQHEREAEIIAQAGRPGSVTIATNMAGRGVDILLGGNAEGLARRELRRKYPDLTTAPQEEWDAELKKWQAKVAEDRAHVKELGGLHIIGTDRHEARRIDNQLRGRAGRQGDPGSSRFYLSLEDDLMRRFGGQNIAGLMERFGLDEDTPIEAGMINRAIENAQTKVEGHNFDIRKRVLDYDDVVNKQRHAIYAQRTHILQSDLRESIEEMIEDALEESVRGLLEEDDDGTPPDFHIALSAIRAFIPVAEEYDIDRWETLDPDEIMAELKQEVKRLYDEREVMFGAETMREVERQLMLDIIDQHWIRHLTELDDLRQGIGLRAMAQQDPLVAYRTEASMLWQEMTNTIKDTMARRIFTVRPAIVERKAEQREMHENRSDEGSAGETPAQPIRAKARPGRNDPCHCGSGKKYKNCHWAEDEKKQRAKAAAVR
jgi:preprotein translocase subunit SecA